MAADADWWRRAVVYQVYPRSFQDSDGDGIGDLAGVSARVGYLRRLGVDAVWLSPFYPSALADGGYDVDDHRGVDPVLGDLTVFDSMVAALHGAGIRVVVDIVPNHTSDRHRWFQEALAAGPGSRARKRYVFRDGRGPSGELPPSDWPSHFGPSCWTRVPDGQWYLHLFAPEQPDLNWADDEVRADLITTLRFWADRGVDGFRVDAAHCLVKDLSEPWPEQLATAPDLLPEDGSHPLFDRDELHEVYRTWRQVFAEYDPPRVAVAEAPAPLTRRAAYGESLGQVFSFELIEAAWDAGEIRAAVDQTLALSARSGTPATWALANHDNVRQVTRYGLPVGTDLMAWLGTGGTEPASDLVRGLARARAAALLMLALPGSAYLYQGEELGLPEVADLPEAALQDPMWRRSGGTVKGRDGCRVPLPWAAAAAGLGFTAGVPHLPQPAAFADLAADRQDGRRRSTLELYRHALRLRRELTVDDAVEWVPAPPDVLHLRRSGGWDSVMNAGTEPVPVPPGVVVLSSGRTPGVMLPPDTTVWLRAGS